MLTTAPRPWPQHDGQHVAQPEEYALLVHGDDPVEFRLVVLVGRAELALDAGIVEEGIDAAEFLQRARHVGRDLARTC